MPRLPETVPFDRIHGRFDAALYALSAYAVPIVIGLLSALALLTWPPQFTVHTPDALAFQVIEEQEPLSPAQALAKLHAEPRVDFLDTRRSEAPFWFYAQVPQLGQPAQVEFPSRHSIAMSCWNAATLAPIGNATRTSTEGTIAPVKAGFTIPVPQGASALPLLCKAIFVGPARLTALHWPTAELQASAGEFQRKSGLLDGGLIILALFMLVTASIMRQSRYVLFAAWLLINLRLAALSAGWDTQWFGYQVPPEAVLRMRLLTVALYCVLGVTLFKSLFQDELKKIGNEALVRLLQWTAAGLLLLSVWMPYKSFLPLLWVESAVIVVSLLYLTYRILVRTFSRVALWYGASLFVALVAGLSEVLSAAFGLRELTGAVNSVTAALSSSLLAALAIAEQMRQEHQQRLEVQAELAHTYEAMPVGLFTLDARGSFLSANPALNTMLDTDVLARHSHWDEHFAEGSLARLVSLAQTGADVELEVDGLADGAAEKKRFLIKATLARGKIEGSLQDITEKARALKELQFTADHDALTKVYNRRGIERMLADAMKHLEQGKPLALAYLDLDRFKLINGLYGHTVGDVVLTQVCGRAAALLTGNQGIGRVGGDEFIIVMPHTPINAAAWICKGIVDRIGGEPYRISDKAFKVRASIGLVEVLPGTSMKDAISTADQACREAKERTATGLVVYDKTSGAFLAREAELKLVERLSEDAAPAGLFLEMQPIMSVAAPFGCLNFEVLLRMRDHDGSVIPAGRIIGAAENSGRTGIVDRWVLSTTLAWIEEHSGTLLCTQFVCMNLSGASLNDERFIQDTVTLLEQHPAAARRLCIEITESVALHDMGNTRRFIERVRGYGVRIALDDFGAGYTSFTYLKDLPADVLKIDGSFVVNINSHPANAAIVEAIVNLAKSLGMQTIAEWAEDTQTVQTLAEIGVDHIQGFVIARPQPSSRILEAGSAADFIKDANLRDFVRILGESPFSLAQMDLLAAMDRRS